MADIVTDPFADQPRSFKALAMALPLPLRSSRRAEVSASRRVICDGFEAERQTAFSGCLCLEVPAKPGMKRFIERNIIYADRNDRPWKNGRQYGAETLARRPRLRGFRYVGEGGGGTGSRESDRGGEPRRPREETPETAGRMADGARGRCRSVDRQPGAVARSR